MATAVRSTAKHIQMCGSKKGRFSLLLLQQLRHRSAAAKARL